MVFKQSLKVLPPYELGTTIKGYIFQKTLKVFDNLLIIHFEWTKTMDLLILSIAF